MMKDSFRQQLWIVVVLAFVARLLTLNAYPLTDNTEARYAEIARKICETGHWIVPQIDYGVPFWGKPPLFVLADRIVVQGIWLQRICGATSVLFTRRGHMCARLPDRFASARHNLRPARQWRRRLDAIDDGLRGWCHDRSGRAD